MKYKLLSGPFEGAVVEEGQILDVPFDQLDDDMQERITGWNDALAQPWRNMDSAKTYYENTWECERSNDPVTMKPLSEW